LWSVVVIVMGGAAAGVTAIGRALAAEMNWRFVNEHDSSDSSEATTLTRVHDTRLLAGREHSRGSGGSAARSPPPLIAANMSSSRARS